MKILRGKKLRANIFLAFLSIMIASEVIIFGIFYLIDNQRQNTTIRELVKTTGYLYRDLVQVTLPSDRITPDSRPYQYLHSFMSRVRRANPSLVFVWITDSANRVLIQSPPGPLPSLKLRFLVRIDHMEVLEGRDGRGYMTHLLDVPVRLTNGAMVRARALSRSLYKLERKDILFLLILLGLTIAIGPIALYVSRSITRPLRDLTDTARQVSYGDLSVRAPIRSADEIGDLAYVFNGMLDMIEKMIRGTRELAANVSHELRTPLTRILISRELLEDNLDRFKPEFFAKHLDLIRKDVEKLDLMISRILHLSRLEIQPGMEVPERIDLGEICLTVAESFSGAFQGGRVRYEEEIGEDMIVSGLRDDLLMALSNLMENAVKYTPKQGTIRIVARKEADEAVISIRNSIPEQMELPDDPARLFEPFYRPKTRIRRGSGLGLAISARVIRAMQGDIQARVEDAVFEVRIRLPLGI